MLYAEANRRVSNWLASSGIEMESGKILDSRGCCFVSQGENSGFLIMLPPNQTTLYFIAYLYTPDMHNDTNLLAYCLELNCLFLTSLQAAAIGLDAENRKLILRSAHPLRNESEAELDAWLHGFSEKAAQIREKIKLFFHSAKAKPSRPIAEGKELHSQYSR